ncbi:purine permease 21-like [Argentina anserina]|uniref:purine permease 21-like n=1 Tax=Argentina anserina TaxID=57926 RepID=UPI0021762D66|nr:purine permease 21-like [Potentilla anserina]XP_050368310.1 purine permease 21-like [Potentilla anserina]
MGEVEAQELQLSIMAQAEENEGKVAVPNQLSRRRGFDWWLRMSIYTVLVLAGQAIATLLGRQYYEKGGSSNWLATLVQLCGFPILLPVYFIPALNKNCPTTNSTIALESNPPSTLVRASVYASLGALVAADCYLYSVGLSYLPVSTYSLICASQLAFNALFSFFLNSQKFTPYIVNSLVVLTISSSLLVLQGDDDSADSSKVSRPKYIIGFICTLGASAGYALQLSLTQLIFVKVIRKETFKEIINMIVYPSIFSSAIILVGFFASGDWKVIQNEMEAFELGKVSYIMNLAWTAITWALFSIGTVGLVFEASSLFSNAISAVGLPIVPVIAVIFFHDKMDGIKAMSMVLAIWGFISYVYQHYLDDRKSKREKIAANDAPSKAFPLENI